MRGALKYGVPIAAGLATGGYALSQGEDPGSAGLAAGLGATGAAGGLLGARLAGKYSKDLTQRALGKVEDAASQASARMPDASKRANILMDISEGAGNLADRVSERQISKGFSCRYGSSFCCSCWSWWCCTWCCTRGLRYAWVPARY